MTNDARFEDGIERPLRLRALDGSDLEVVSTLVQDAVLAGDEIRWDDAKRRLALLINRFRWEDAKSARDAGRAFERVRSLLVVEDVTKVGSQGVTKGSGETICSILSLAFEPGEDGSGSVVITLAGDGAIRAEVEALEVVLKDVTRPYSAPSRRAPAHEA